MNSRPADTHFRGIVSATRLHMPPDAEAIPEVTIEHLRKYVQNVRELGIEAAIAVNSMEDEIKRIAEETAPDYKINVLHVPCWGAFVPALNALLNFAQRQGMRFILYQSLEVRCTAPVLRRLLDHYTSEHLVVGPVFNGHDFAAGEQPLNGRTTPWNTLALWSVRKLALTGFLQIADGLPDMPSIGGSRDNSPTKRLKVNPQEAEDELAPMGSHSWWHGSKGMARQCSAAASVPAGVEEVTAIALLQHLNGVHRSRATLLQLPPELEAQLSWTSSWGGDERRAQWHKYKMESKVSRPAAQLEELFRHTRTSSSPNLALPPTSPIAVIGKPISTLFRRRQSIEENKELEKEHTPQAAVPSMGPTPLHFGMVMHYGESIQPPAHVKWICLCALGLFNANSTAVLAMVFRYMNASGPVAGRESGPSLWDLLFYAAVFGGVYVPMPISLWLSRTVIQRASHIAGLLLFASFLLLGHVGMVIQQIVMPGPRMPLVIFRLIQGLGSGVLFQARFVLAQMSTNDQQVDLQSWNFLMSDLGLGIGALLPATMAMLPGMGSLQESSPDILPSLALTLISLCFMVWVMMSFPRHLPFLPDKVRCMSRTQQQQEPKPPAAEATGMNPDRWSLYGIWLSGTTRVMVQAAILPVVALSMRDAHWTGNYRQTFAVAAISLLPMPFEAVVSRICCTCSFRSGKDETHMSKMISGAIGAGALLLAGLNPRNVQGEEGEIFTMLTRITELGILMIALGMAAPFNASRLYLRKDAERAIVMLEWQKAYIGRLLGPLLAVLLYSYHGYGPVLAVLCLATAVVIGTA